MHRPWTKASLLVALLTGITLLALVTALPVGANPPRDSEPPTIPPLDDVSPPVRLRASRPVDRPNTRDYARALQRRRLMSEGRYTETAALAMEGSDRALVLLVEFAGTDEFTWTPGVSLWDPLGRVNSSEAVRDASGHTVEGDCSKILAETTVFTYTGPLHNQLPRPTSANDESADSIFTDDFNKQWFESFMFGSGVTISYTCTDGTRVLEDFTGKSVRHYYQDISGGRYSIAGDVIGWLQLPHSTWWYGADLCPGALSGNPGGSHDGAIPGAGSPHSMVRDALAALNAISDTIPGFDWANYDLDGDGVIDRLWIVHAGYGEEESTRLNATSYGEAAVWSHSSELTKPYVVAPGISAGPYIMMPENGGIGVFAHESAHNLGASDLYDTQYYGESSAGFWTLMADDWTGYPAGFQPPAPDPLALDQWGWLDPMIVTDATKVYTVTVGQASAFPGGPGVYRGVKIPLPRNRAPQAVQPIGGHQYWGGRGDLIDARMVTKLPIIVPPAGATLSVSMAYGTEEGWDFLWVGVSTDLGATWRMLTNDDTVCEHDPGWIGGLYGLPDDLCSAGLGGFSGYNRSFPDYDTESFDLTPYAGKPILLAFWYMTDWAGSYVGPFLDNIAVLSASGVPVFYDDGEAGDGRWLFLGGWGLYDGWQPFDHNLYLQWRNVSPTGGYDSALADPRYRFGPANTGLLVWYNNLLYTDNNFFGYLFDHFGFGPKGLMMVVDSHPDPYRDPWLEAYGYYNEAANVTSRSLMRDAPFSLWDSVSFEMGPPFVHSTTRFAGRPAVTSFHDSLGYHPGAESVSRGPGYVPPSIAWVTKQWDASVVLPSREFYGLRAQGYEGGMPFRFGSEPVLSGPNTGKMLAYTLWEGLGYDGGSGDPRQVGGQYGWHVQILEQTAMTATLRIWNSVVHSGFGHVPNSISAPGIYTLTYSAFMYNAGPNATTGTVTMSLPSNATLAGVSPTAAVVDSRVRWERVPLPVAQVVTFTASMTVQVSRGDPIAVYQAHGFAYDGSGDRPIENVWRTDASLFGMAIGVDGPAARDVAVGQTVTYSVRITNTGYNDDTYQVQAVTVPGSWVTSLMPTTPVTVAAGHTRVVLVSVAVPATAAAGAVGSTSVRVDSLGDARLTRTLPFSTQAIGRWWLATVFKGLGR